MEKIDLDLTGVPKTLLLPLLGRAQLSQKPNSPFKDQRAIDIVNRLNYDFDALAKQLGNTALYWMARAHYFDLAIKKYLEQHPDAVIVNLGAGLETAFHRVDNGKLTWIDLDLPEVITLREKLLPKNDRVHAIKKSILDFSWINDIKDYGNHFFFFAGGLFMYLEPPQVQMVFIELANAFNQSELIFDTISKKGLKYGNKMLKENDMKNAVLQWGIDNPKDLEQWSKRIKVLYFNQSFKYLPEYQTFPLWLRLKMKFLNLFDKSGLIHLQFNNP